MKKSILMMAIASVLTLAACDSETIADVEKAVEKNNAQVKASARVIFDPSNGELSVPNDLLFQDTNDGTLNLPVDDPNNGADPSVAINALDGWSTVNPFLLSLDFPDNTELDASSVSSAVKIYEATMGGDVLDADCTDIERGLACKILNELTFGVDFIAQKSGNNIAVVPLIPLKAETTYLLALTNSLKDSNNNPVSGSTSYELVRQNIITKPLGSTAQLSLQAIINSFESVLINEGVAADSLIYTMAMTTQSTTKVIDTLKDIMASNPVQEISVSPSTLSVNDLFLLQGRVLSESLQALYSTANYHTGNVTLPYYLPIPSVANPMAPVNNWWKARCDSGAMLAGLAAQNPAAIPDEALDANDGFCIAVGLRDLSSAIALDTERNLTKFNPVPVAQGASDISYISHPGEIDVQMTSPNISPVTDAVRASYGLPALNMPENGWPVVILSHGITSKKEDMLALTGLLSTFGFATIAIDHPLHGSRGFDLDPSVPGDEINASTVSATHYMNLGSLLTTRDNLRQSTADNLGLRLGLNALTGVNIDTANVHFLGHSLGAITGVNFIATANTPLSPAITQLNPAIDAMFEVKTNSLAMPGIMVANLLVESARFGDVIKSTLTLEQSADFQAFVASQYTNPTEEELVSAYQLFFNKLSTEQQTSLNSVFSQFIFAAQTVTDAGDPINYATRMAATQTLTHLIEVVGDGDSNLSDQVIPNSISRSPLGGTQGLVSLLALANVSETTMSSGVVKFLNGHHGSILSPEPRDSAPNALLTGAATQEMQLQATGFFVSGGQVINITNSAVVQ